VFGVSLRPFLYPPDRWGVKQSLCPLFRPSVRPFPCDNLSFLGATGLKLHTQVAYVRGRCGIAIEVNGQGHGYRCPSVTSFPCNILSFLGATGLKLHTKIAYVRGRCGIAIEVKGQGPICPLHSFRAIT
jgi:hypothetical protein